MGLNALSCSRIFGAREGGIIFGKKVPVAGAGRTGS